VAPLESEGQENALPCSIATRYSRFPKSVANILISKADNDRRKLCKTYEEYLVPVQYAILKIHWIKQV
jgi:hypothetical protein